MPNLTEDELLVLRIANRLEDKMVNIPMEKKWETIAQKLEEEGKLKLSKGKGEYAKYYTTYKITRQGEDEIQKEAVRKMLLEKEKG